MKVNFIKTPDLGNQSIQPIVVNNPLLLNKGEVVHKITIIDGASCYGRYEGNYMRLQLGSAQGLERGICAYSQAFSKSSLVELSDWLRQLAERMP